MKKKLFILLLNLLFIFNCKSNFDFTKITFIIENRNLAITNEKKEVKIDFNNNVDNIINNYKAKHCLSGGSFDTYTIQPYPFDFTKIYHGDNKDKVVGLTIVFDLKKGQKTGQDRLNKYAEEFKNILN